MTIQKKKNSSGGKQHARKEDFYALAQDIISGVGVGIYIVQDRKFVFVSDLFEKITGFSQKELLGSESLKMIHPDDLDTVKKQAIKRLKRENLSPYEYRYINKANETRWVLETVTPIMFRGRRAALGSFMDITDQKRTQEALRQSEEKYRAIIENIEDGYVELDLKGNFIFFNDAISKMHGYPKEELLKMNYHDIMDSENASKIYTKYNKVFATGLSEKGFEYEVITKGGEKRFLETSITPIKDAQGRVTAFRSIVRDRTEHKKAEIEREATLEKLRQSEEKYRNILETMQEGYFEVDLAGNFTFFNDALCRLYGYSKNELMGINYRHYTDKENAALLFQTFNRVYRTGVPVKELAWKSFRKDGTPLYVEASASLIKNPSGKPVGFRGIIKDVTERKQMESDLKQSEKKYRSILESIQEAYFEVDLAGNFTFFNDSLCRLTGCSREELIGTNYKYFSDEENSRKVFHAFNNVYRTGQATEAFDWMIVRKDGTQRYIEASVSPRQDAAGKTIGFQGVIRDITERKKVEQELNYLATHDALTGLPNRLMFTQHLNQAILSAKRNRRKLAVFFIDLDRFKIINDSLGHEAGDILLKEIAKRLKNALRAVDVVGRLGGDEFVILIENFMENAHLAKVAQKVLAAAIKPFRIMDEDCRVTASIGISIYPQDGQDEQTLMKNADIAMYMAKEAGKNNFQFYSANIKSLANERLMIEKNLRLALERKEFYLDYQAKVDFKTHAITGVEALLRWRNDYLGDVTPTQFIPVAEETGLIVPIGKWVLKTACAQNVAWQKQGLPPVCMAVNLSMRQLMDDNLLEDIRETLSHTGMSPNLLELEITESMIMHNPARLVPLLTKIKQMGIRLAIDDFGTGYSSLAQLKNFPVDTLKVDRSFIRNIPENSEDRAITEAIISMGKTLSMTVVAEGVETEEQEQFLRERVCDEMQGFYFSKPIKAEEFASLLRTHQIRLPRGKKENVE
jgi:diguanylate cyclase (GGDEF)-like protein/PAS domain S-box-containing protein